jgi:hypothetical protein
MCRRCLPSPQVDAGNAGEVCAAALDGRLAAALPALLNLYLEPLALQAMAQQHDAADLSAALADCGALRLLVVRPPLALGVGPPASQEGGAQLAQLVARLPSLKFLSVQACGLAFFEVRLN